MSRYRNDRRSETRGLDRRHAPRVGTRIDTSVMLSATFLDALADGRDTAPLTFFGHTRDVSPAGIGIIIPFVTLDPRACAKGLPLKLRLDLPGGDVEIKAEVVRCEPLGDRGMGEGSLVGAKVRDEDAARMLIAAAGVTRGH